MALLKLKYKLADGSMSESTNWYYRFNFKKKIYSGCTNTPNKVLAKKVEDKKRQELVAKFELGVNASVSVQQAIKNFLDANLTHKQLENINTHASKFLGKKRDTKFGGKSTSYIDVFGFDPERTFESITMADMQQWVVERRKEHNSNSTILNELSTLSQIIKLNQKLNVPVPNIDFRSLKRDNRIKPSKGKLRFLTRDEEEALLNELHPDNVIEGVGAVPTDQIKSDRQDIFDLVVVLLDTGARYNEIAKLRFKEIDLKKKTINIYRTKVGNESVLHMTNRVYEILSRRWEDRRQGQLFVFENRDGQARNYATKAFKSACRRAGIEGVTIHTLRHSFASRLAQNGLSIQELKELLGHSSITTTMIYAHLIPNAAASKAASVLNRLGGAE